jgi:hypothetical protein
MLFHGLADDYALPAGRWDRGGTAPTAGEPWRKITIQKILKTRELLNSIVLEGTFQGGRKMQESSPLTRSDWI